MIAFMYSSTWLLFFLGIEGKYIRKLEIRIFTVVLITTSFFKLGLDYAYANLSLLFLHTYTHTYIYKMLKIFESLIFILKKNYYKKGSTSHTTVQD
jgi:hypothetical protein